ncbi:MAG: WD40/YVTN/BNR-like repeat-containing protein [Acidimicrobiales bacterium]
MARTARSALSALAVVPALVAVVTTSVAGAATVGGSVIGQPAPKGTGDLEAVACATASTCWAVGAMPVGRQTPSAGGATVVLARTGDGGVDWSDVRLHTAAPVELSAVSCPDRRHCTAVGATSIDGLPVGAVLATADGGREWVARGRPPGSVDVVGVACRSASACVALATDGTTYWAAATTDGGRSWRRQGSLPAGFGGAGDLVCPTAGRCLVAGYTAVSPAKGAGAVALTDDGGATWRLAAVPAGTGLLHAVACPGPGRCLSAGTTSSTDTDLAPAPGTVLASTDGGDSFSAGRQPAGVDDGFGLACPTPRRCVLVGTTWTSGADAVPSGAVAVSDDGGRRWRAVPTRYVPAGLIGVACPSTTACVAAGNDVVARIALPPPAAGSTGTGGPTSAPHGGRHQSR